MIGRLVIVSVFEALQVVMGKGMEDLAEIAATTLRTKTMPCTLHELLRILSTNYTV